MADLIPNRAINLDLILREVWNLPVVLLVPGISEQDDSLDFVLDSVGQFGDGAVHDGRSLTIITIIISPLITFSSLKGRK